jgi:HlyD family secretion protein
MKSRSRLLRHGCRTRFACGLVAVGLILYVGGLFPLQARQATPSGVADRKDRRSATPTLEERLRAQQLTTRRAKAEYEIARLNRELAEIAAAEFAERTDAENTADLEGEVKLAESGLTRSGDRLTWARRMFAKGLVSRAQLVSEDINFKKSEFEVERARTKLKVYVEYTRQKPIKEIKEAHAEELAKRATWKREEAREAILDREVARK